MSAPNLNIRITSPVKLPIPQPLEFKVERNTTVILLKEEIRERFPTSPALTPDKQRIIFRGKILIDDCTLERILKDSNMETAETVHFHLSIPPTLYTQKKKEPAPIASTTSFNANSPASSSSRNSVVSADPSVNSQGESLLRAQYLSNPPNSFTSAIPALSSPELQSEVAQPELPFGLNHSHLRRHNHAASSVASNLSKQVTRTQTAGICDLSAYTTTNANDTTSVNILGNRLITSIDSKDIMLMKNYSGKLLCCLSPEALTKLKPVWAEKGLNLRPVYSKTPIVNKNISEPGFNDDAEIDPSRVYLGLPPVIRGTKDNNTTLGVNLPPLIGVMRAAEGMEFPGVLPEVVLPRGVRNPHRPPRAVFNIGLGFGNIRQFHVTLRIGNRRIVLRPQMMRNALIIGFILFRVCLEIGMPTTLISCLHFLVVILVLGACLAIMTWSDLAREMLNQVFHRIVNWLPYMHPAVPNQQQPQLQQHRDPEPPAGANNDVGQENNRNMDQQQQEDDAVVENAQNDNVAEQDPTWQQNVLTVVKNAAWAVQGFVFLFIGSLIPYFYERWQREDMQRRQHAEEMERNRVAEQERIQREQEEQRRNQDSGLEKPLIQVDSGDS